MVAEIFRLPEQSQLPRLFKYGSYTLQEQVKNATYKDSIF